MCPQNCTDTIVRNPHAAQQPMRGVLSAAISALRPTLDAAVATFRAWRERKRYRGYLAAMDDRGLRDIGLCRSDAQREANRPVWAESILNESSRGRVRRG